MIEFIDGVTCHAVHEGLVGDSTSILITIGVIGAVAALLCIVYGIVLWAGADDPFLFFSGVGVALIAVILLIIGCNLPTYSSYVVTIDDTCSITEFLQTYNIEKVEGDLYTITIKED